jgi:hypothetical protein
MGTAAETGLCSPESELQPVKMVYHEISLLRCYCGAVIAAT